jgi:hypothetical protein
MGDVFKEQIVKRKQTTKNTIIRIVLIFAVTMVFFISFALGLGPLAVLLTGGAIFGALYIHSFFVVEYEYVFTNGELDIDVIYNRSRRKRVFSAHVNAIEVMAHVENKNHIREFDSSQETRDYTSGTVTESTYAFLIPLEGKRLKVIIEPNEKMLAAFKTVISPRKLHISS